MYIYDDHENTTEFFLPYDDIKKYITKQLKPNISSKFVNYNKRINKIYNKLHSLNKELIMDLKKETIESSKSDTEKNWKQFQKGCFDDIDLMTMEQIDSQNIIIFHIKDVGDDKEDPEYVLKTDDKENVKYSCISKNYMYHFLDHYFDQFQNSLFRDINNNVYLKEDAQKIYRFDTRWITAETMRDLYDIFYQKKRIFNEWEQDSSFSYSTMMFIQVDIENENERDKNIVEWIFMGGIKNTIDYTKYLIENITRLEDNIASLVEGDVPVISKKYEERSIWKGALLLHNNIMKKITLPILDEFPEISPDNL